MIEDKYIDFFIGGNINEPVAIEIPFRTKQIGALKPFLEKYGLDIDTDGMHPEKISLNLDADKEGWYSLITPAMNPQDLKNIYKLLYSFMASMFKPKFFDKISKILKFKTHKKDDVENTNTTMVVNRQSVHSFNI